MAEYSNATAVLYLRVSSAGQMNKAHDPEGFSLPGQRAACQRHADQLGARVVGEFVEHGQSGTSTNRTALRDMLAQLPALRPTYVIVYDLSRLARDDFDALFLLTEIEKAGSKLESTLERVDNTPAGRLLYTVMAGVNAFRSRGDAEKVRMGLAQKHAAGGTNGAARIGYLNVRQLVDGREVRTIAVDEDRYRLVQLAFDAFATGEHSITTLRDLLEEVGLRTRPTAKRPAKPLSRNGVFRILRDDYYLGVVTLNGVKRPGLHTPLIERETFDKVQRVLDAHRLSGDRTQKHFHYLKGSIFCGRCGRRLVFGRHRGNGGVYEYFGCLSHQGRRPSCGMRHMAVNAVETAIENYYRSVQLSPASVRRSARRSATRSRRD